MDVHFLKMVNAELDNIRVSWSWALQQENYDVIDHLIDTLMMYFHKHSRTLEIGDMFQSAASQLANCTGRREQSVLGRVLAQLGGWSALQSRIDEADSILQQSMVIAREQNNMRLFHSSQCFYAWFILAICRAEYARALSMLEQSVTYYRNQDEPDSLSWSSPAVSFA